MLAKETPVSASDPWKVEPAKSLAIGASDSRRATSGRSFSPKTIQPVNDGAGSKRAGWSSVWLDPAREGLGLFEQVAEGDGRPDAVVTTLDDPPAALDGLDR